jgi:hypothetical protein
MHQHPWPLRAFDAREPIITVIAVTEAIQESLGMFAASSRREAEQHNRRTGATISSLQRKLYRKAKAEPNFRFYLHY